MTNNKRVAALALVLVAWFSLPCQAAIAHVSRSAGGQSASSATSATAAQSHTAGNAVIVAVYFQTAASVSSVANTATDTFARCGTLFSSGAGNIDIWAAVNSAGNGSDVVTATFNTNATYGAIVAHEFSGLGTSNPCDGSGSTGSGSSTSISTGTVTISGAEDVIVFLGEADADTWNTGGTYAVSTFAVSGDLVPYFADGYHIVTANEAATGTTTITGPWIVAARAFKNAGGGSVPGCKNGLVLLGAGCDELRDNRSLGAGSRTACLTTVGTGILYGIAASLAPSGGGATTTTCTGAMTTQGAGGCH
jgi:hypothetical protein